MPVYVTATEVALLLLESPPLSEKFKPGDVSADEIVNAFSTALEKALESFKSAFPEYGEELIDAIAPNLLASEIAKFFAKGEFPDTFEIIKAWGDFVPQVRPFLNRKQAADILFQRIIYYFRAEPLIESLRTPISREEELLMRTTVILTGIAEKLIAKEEFDLAKDILQQSLVISPDLSASYLLERVEEKSKTANKKPNDERIHFFLESSIPANDELTSLYLSNKITPYLNAITNLQSVINEIQNRPENNVLIKSIRQSSPIGISLDGASQAIELINNNIVPWRKKHAQIMAQLIEQAKLVEIESGRAEVLERRARAEKERMEANKQRGELERIKLENDKLRLELNRAKIELAVEVISSLAPGISENDRVAYLVKLLPALDIIATDILNLTIDE